MQSWSSSSWTQCPHTQSVTYPDPDAQFRALKTLQQLPPLVTAQSVLSLATYLEKAEQRKVFLLQAGDCAESFEDCKPEIVQKKLELMDQMSALLAKYLQKPIIQIGRIAGQFAKARTHHFETRENLTLPSYRGELINGLDFTAPARTPNPERLLQSYHNSAYVLSLLHAYPRTSLPFFTSHEALHLPYEQSLTRYEKRTQRWYLLSTHLPWIGVRTNDSEGAHIEFMRGISNPIGLKIGPDATPDWLYAVLSRLNPHRQSGRIVLITRFGAKKVETCLPPLIQLVKKEGFPVTWSCDPMHGNTTLTNTGLKTRAIETITEELESTLRLHQSTQGYLGGVHLELTAEHVTECIGGQQGLCEHDLKQAYRSLVDPRLNHGQSLEITSALGQMHIKTNDKPYSFHEQLPPIQQHAQEEYPA